MCDTFVVLPSASASGRTILAKNSDREPNEAQGILKVPRRRPSEATLQTTYIRIPQVALTHELILCKPFQMWGAEMGINEHGLAIGNEAVFTKVPFQKKQVGLTGMDLVRLALERATTTEQAIELIASLLAQYGQNAPSGYYNQNFYYHNSFLLADATSAWVLETAGKEWAAQRVRTGVRSISNGLTIGEEFDLSSPGLVDYARQQGWLKPLQTFHFAQHYSAWFMTHMSSCHLRQAATSTLAKQPAGLSVGNAMQVLRSHESADFEPHKGSTASVCMHATGLLTPNQTAGSMVADIGPSGDATVWLTGTSSPCLSVFKPVWIRGKFLEDFTQPSAQFDASFWWQAERLFRQSNYHYKAIAQLLDADNRSLQQSLLDQVAGLSAQSTPIDTLDQLSSQAFFMHYNAIQIASEQWATTRRKASLSLKPWYRWYWHRQSHKAGIIF